ncbi:MAG: hypothetical protein ACON4R_09265 [Akkermansiaceae bacterium]
MNDLREPIDLSNLNNSEMTFLIEFPRVIAVEIVMAAAASLIAATTLDIVPRNCGPGSPAGNVTELSQRTLG